MKQTDIISLKITPKLNYNQVKLIYDNILHVDKSWHFFCEYDHTLLRCCHKYVQKVEACLSDRIVEQQGLWEEPWDFTKKYQKHFGILFHEFSVMAMLFETYKYSEMALERINHCFCNMHKHNWIKKLHVNNEFELEGKVLAEILIQRVFINGYITRVAKEQEKRNERY